MTHLSIVVPVYKAEDCLQELYRRLLLALTPITDDFEIILVEDAGGDHSWRIITELSSRDSRVRGIRLSRNFGQHYAITAGLDHATGEWTVVMDCDLQDRPEEIPVLYAKAQEGYDIVFAARSVRQDSWLRKIQSRLYNQVFCYLTDISVDASIANFSIISKKVVQSCCLMREQLRFYSGLLEWVGFKKTTVAVEHGARFSGESSYTFKKLLQLATNTILAHSDKPLKLVIKLGFCMSLFSFAYGLYTLVKSFFYQIPIMGWSSLIVSLYFLSGIIIGTLGIIGIYVGKTFDEAKKRPLYIIAQTTDAPFA